VKTWLEVKFADTDLIEPENVTGLWVRVYPPGKTGGIWEAELDRMYKTPSKNSSIISSELPRKDFPIFMNQYKNAYITVKYLMESIKDGRVEFWYKGTE